MKRGIEPMAYSLSWWKKRTAALNKQYGTSLSPRRLKEIYERTGTLPSNVAQVQNLPDPRAYGRFMQYEQAALTSNQAIFYQLGNANRYVKRVLWGESTGGYITAGGTVYGYEDGAWKSWAPNSKEPKEVSHLPTNIKPLTSTTTRELIIAKAKEIHAKYKEHPGRGYLSV